MDTFRSTFNRKTETWSVSYGLPSNPGLVIYAQGDGGFSVWDPARNYWKKPVWDEERHDWEIDEPKRPAAYLFTAKEVWEGNKRCEGLIRDWASWQREDGDAFSQLKSILRTLSPSLLEPLVPGELRKVSLNDPKRYPTLKMHYGYDVPLIHGSAGMRRIVALAYLLVWTWQEHLVACKILGDTPTREIIFLIDDIEAHLHPKWQRCVVPALLEVMEALTGEHNSKTQLIAATHAPLVLASIEAVFDENRDGLFLLDLEGQAGEVNVQRVTLTEQAWAKQGDVVGWLVSDTFGLLQGRSLDAEQAIEAAEAWMRGDHDALPPNLNTESCIHDELTRTLAGHDSFWPRWIVQREAGSQK